ncbi:DUF6678 family protein [Vibrio coralliilyticus]|uniref:DUF6678 family protein n=1 Tax=Vibrio coralliilyticus TaxID=190893 RepID=UPI00156049B2|nr:DUF6678 family protein [Vibrio coralliilyticus]NRF28364.1 hypothetical protein [Vibrio coralliilyticus]NRF51825.1 hypothetical protein [Vibrio coralliilyticus]
MLSVMNKTKWNELRLKMSELEVHSPKWRTKDIESGHISEWDGDWYYHLELGGFRCIEWVELKTKGSIHHELIRVELQKINLPGNEIKNGFRVYGYIADGQFVDYV